MKSGFVPDYSEETLTIEQVHDMRNDTILEFGAPWCSHCQIAQPMLENVLASQPELSHIKFYDGKGNPVGRAFNVKLWPTLILLRNGKEVGRLIRPLHINEIYHLVMKTK
jgi:thioredoxin 1